MDELDRRIHTLKKELRKAINKGGLSYSIVETVLDALKAECLQMENYALREQLEESEEKKNDHAELQTEPDPEPND